MQPEAVRLWQALWNQRGRFQSPVERADHSFETQLVVGEFAATIETVENANDPVIVTASVGWSDSQAFQKYDFDETFCMPGQSPFPEQS